jgi:hypothetical protein
MILPSPSQALVTKQHPKYTPTIPKYLRFDFFSILTSTAHFIKKSKIIFILTIDLLHTVF